MTEPRTPTIPRTTQLPPDIAVLRAAMRRAAEPAPGDVPILSAYLDLRPEAHGERPYARAELVPVRDRLAAIIDGYAAHDPARRSLEDDRQRLEALLDDDMPVDAEGLALVAAGALGLWEALTTAVPFETDVAAGPIADLYPLAHFADETHHAVVALADSHACRLLTWRRGALREARGPSEPADEHRRHEQGGWAQARFQRHIDEQDRRFLRRAADAIDRFAADQRATAILICADERTAGTLLGELPERSRGLVVDVRHLSMHSTRDEVRAEIAPILSALETERSAAVAERAVAGHASNGLGAIGIEPTRAQLEAGAVSDLVFDAEAARAFDRWDRAGLVRQAVLTDATIVVADHAELRSGGGVGAVLRFRAGAGPA